VARQATEEDSKLAESFTRELPLIRLCQGRLQRVENVPGQNLETTPPLQKQPPPSVSERTTRAKPLLCLHRGVLQPPPMPQGRENRVSIGHGPAPGASP
jgi:hypothetical protein